MISMVFRKYFQLSTFESTHFQHDHCGGWSLVMKGNEPLNRKRLLNIATTSLQKKIIADEDRVAAASYRPRAKAHLANRSTTHIKHVAGTVQVQPLQISLPKKEI